MQKKKNNKHNKSYITLIWPSRRSRNGSRNYSDVRIIIIIIKERGNAGEPDTEASMQCKSSRISKRSFQENESTKKVTSVEKVTLVVPHAAGRTFTVC